MTSLLSAPSGWQSGGTSFETRADVNALPPNPFNNQNTIVIDNSTTDLTARTVTAADNGHGYKFFTQTGILIACDGGSSNGVAHENF